MDLAEPAIQKNSTRAPISRDRGWSWFRMILTGLVFCRGVVVLCVMPPFEAWDEYQHLGYMAYLAETGERPVLGKTDVPVSLLARLSAFPQSRSALRQLSGWGTVDYATYWSRASEGELPKAAMVTGPPVRLYQAQHGPLYYRLVLPLFRALGGVSDLKTTVGGLRLVNLLLTSASVWIALGIVNRRVRDARLAALSGLLIATQPLFLMNGARVANDALGVLLATAAIALAMSFTHRHLIVAFGVGLLVGLAVLAKAVNLGLLPFIAACWLAAFVRDGDHDRGGVRVIQAVASALVLATGFLLVTQSEFRANYQRFGSPTVMQEAVANRTAGRGTDRLIETAGSIGWREWTRKLWFRDSVMSGGWSWSGKHEHLRSRHEVLAVIGLLGWGWVVFPKTRARIFWLFRDPVCPLLCLVLCVGYTGAMGYHTVQSQLSWGSIATNPWYAAAAYPWFLLLVAGGAFAWPIRPLRWLVPGAIALVFLEIEACSVLGSMTAAYAGLAPWGEALRRLASLQPAMFGSATLYAAMALVLVFAGLVVLALLRLVFEPARTSELPPRPNVFSRLNTHAKDESRETRCWESWRSPKSVS